MYWEVNQKLKTAQQGIARKNRIEAMLTQLESGLEALNVKAGSLKEIMEKENYEAEKFENKSLISIFYSIMGSLEERADTERREAIAAKLKYDQAVRDVEHVKSQIEQLNSERDHYVDCEKDYARFFKEKKEKLIREGGCNAEETLKLTEALNLSETRLKELQEAMAAGSSVFTSLEKVYDSLFSAEGWGGLDMLGGGLFTDIIKHSKIDDAHIEVENTQKLLGEFKTELADIKLDPDMIPIDTDSFLHFADYFFDGLIVDCIMLSKISKSMENVSRVKDQVSDIIEELRSLEAGEKNNMEKLTAELDTLVRQVG